MVLVYFDESEKYASSAVTRLRRSDFIAVTYAFDLVLANFGIAIAARMPMITTTIKSSMRVKPRRVRFCMESGPCRSGAGYSHCNELRRWLLKQCRCHTPRT